MKKFNMTPRVKKTLIATGSALVCVGAVALIVTMNSGAAPTMVQPESSSSAVTSVDVSVGDINTVSAVGGQSDPGAFNPSSGASQTSQLTNISKPTSVPPPPVVEGAASTASDGTVTPPTNSALTDHTKKPTYTSKPTVTVDSAPSKASSAPSKSTSSKAPTSSKPSASAAPSGGKPGQKYVPGFGWQYPGSGEGTVVSGMHEDGVKVGIMD